jgi:ribosomal protein S6--L-glutamate ligase
MSEHSLPVVNEYKLIEDVSYPMIVKLKNGSLGIGVKIINTASELKQFWLENNREDWLMQELMEVGRDLRVLVLGGSVMGGMERRAVEGKVVANYSQGGTVNQVELTESQKKLALRAAEVLKLEYAGVDLIRDQERQWRILEVNRCAQFRGFEKATQQNVALEIVDYCIGRLEDTATKVRD